MAKLTVKELLELKGVRQIAFVQVAQAEEALREAMQAMEAGAESIYCGMSPQVVEVLARERFRLSRTSDWYRRKRPGLAVCAQ